MTAGSHVTRRSPLAARFYACLRPSLIFWTTMNCCVAIASFPCYKAYGGSAPDPFIDWAIFPQFAVAALCIHLAGRCPNQTGTRAVILFAYFGIPLLAVLEVGAAALLYDHQLAASLPELERLVAARPLGQSSSPATAGALKVVRTQNKPTVFIAALSDGTHLTCDKTAHRVAFESELSAEGREGQRARWSNSPR